MSDPRITVQEVRDKPLEWRIPGDMHALLATHLRASDNLRYLGIDAGAPAPVQ